MEMESVTNFTRTRTIAAVFWTCASDSQVCVARLDWKACAAGKNKGYVTDLASVLCSSWRVDFCNFFCCEVCFVTPQMVNQGQRTSDDKLLNLKQNRKTKDIVLWFVMRICLVETGMLKVNGVCISCNKFACPIFIFCERFDIWIGFALLTCISLYGGFISHVQFTCFVHVFFFANWRRANEGFICAFVCNCGSFFCIFFANSKHLLGRYQKHSKTIEKPTRT